MKHSILVVEDDPGFSQLLRIYLTRTYSVYVAQHATGAQELIRSEQFDCALIDVNLPDGSGWTLVQDLAEHQAQAIRVIITGFVDRSTEDQASALDVHRIIEKPVTPAEIKAILDDLLA